MQSSQCTSPSLRYSSSSRSPSLKNSILSTSTLPHLERVSKENLQTGKVLVMCTRLATQSKSKYEQHHPGKTESKPITTVDQKFDSIADRRVCLLICTFCTWTQLCLEETICSKSVTQVIGERSSWIDFIFLGWFGSFLLLTQWQAFISSGVCTLCAPYVSFLPGSPPSTKYQLSNRLTLCFAKIRAAFFFSPTAGSLWMTLDEVMRHPRQLTPYSLKSSPGNTWRQMIYW